MEYSLLLGIGTAPHIEVASSRLRGGKTNLLQLSYKLFSLHGFHLTMQRSSFLVLDFHVQIDFSDYRQCIPMPDFYNQPAFQ